MDYRIAYLKSEGLKKGDYCKCKVCSQEAVDIHHIFARQMGGSKSWDFPFNLIALCRKCHDKYGDKKHYYTFLLQKRVRLSDKERTEINQMLNTEEYSFRGYEVPRKFLVYLSKI